MQTDAESDNKDRTGGQFHHTVPGLAASLGEVARRHRVAGNLTRYQVAERLRQRYSSVVSLEKGYHQWTADQVVRVARALRVPPAQLLNEALLDLAGQEGYDVKGQAT